MSTKATIFYRHREPSELHDCPSCSRPHVHSDAPPEHHFYTDVFEVDKVYLDLDGQSMAIPIDVFRKMVESAPKVEENLAASLLTREEDREIARRIKADEGIPDDD